MVYSYQKIKRHEKIKIILENGEIQALALSRVLFEK